MRARGTCLGVGTLWGLCLSLWIGCVCSSYRASRNRTCFSHVSVCGWCGGGVEVGGANFRGMPLATELPGDVSRSSCLGPGFPPVAQDAASLLALKIH